MEGAIPASIEGAGTRISRVTVADNPTMLATLLQIEHTLEEISRADVYRTPTMTVTDLVSGVQHVGLQVYVMNPDLLEHIEAARWAVAYLAYVEMDEVISLLRGIGWRAGQIHQDILQLNVALDTGMAGLAYELTAFADCACTALQAILDQLRAGLRVTGALTLAVDFSGALAGLDIDKLLKLLGIAAGFVALLGVALAEIVGFVYLLAQALKAFDLSIVKLLPNLVQLFDGFIRLMTAIAGFDWPTLGRIAVGFAEIAVFTALLGFALRAFQAETLRAVPALALLFDGFIRLMTTIGGFNWSQLGRIAVGFAEIAAFMALLGLALRLFQADVLAVIPALALLFLGFVWLMTTIGGFNWSQLGRIAVGFAEIAAFMAVLGLALRLFQPDVVAVIPALALLFAGFVRLMTAIGGFDWPTLGRIAVGFAEIAAFIALLGLALRLFTDQAIAAIPALAVLFDSLVSMMAVIAGFSVDQLIQLGLAFLGIAAFIALLGLALDTFSSQAVAAIPGLTQLFESLIELATFINSLSGNQLILIGVAMAALTAFMFGMAAALDIATPGLAELAAVLGGVQAILSSIITIARGAASALSSVLSFSGGGGLGSLLSFQEGGVMPQTGLAVLHEGERVLTADESQALESASSAAPAPGSPLPMGLPAAAPAPVDQSVNVQGGITINISAERLEADSARLLSDEIVQRLQERLGALRSEQEFRNGVRAPAPA